MPSKVNFSDDVAEELVQRAEELQPILLERTSASERDRRLGNEIVGRLEDAGFFRVSAPRRVGGLCASVTSTARIAAALAKGCPSTAWIFCVTNSNALTVSLAGEAIQRDVFANGVPIICGASNPSGTSRQAPGGRVADGRWPYSSGCYHATWGVFSLADKSPEGTPLGATIYVPMSDVTIEDTWHVAGLKATGSNTVVAKAAFVPDHRYTVSAQGSGAGEGAKQGEASDFLGVVPHFRSIILGVLVGMSEAVLERVIARAKMGGITFTTYTTQADSHAVQNAIGEAAVMIQTGRMLMMEAAKAVDAAALGQQPMPYSDRIRNRAQTAYATGLLVDAVGRLITVAGSWAFAASNPLQMYWRDIHVAASHAIAVPRVGYEMYGRDLLGVLPNIQASDELI